MNAPTRKPVGLYIGLAVIAIVVICGIAFIVFINNFLSSPEGQRMKRTIMASERVEGIVPELSASLTAYQKAKGDYPDTLDDLAEFGMTPGKLAAAKELLKYTKPAKDAPGDTVILDTGKMDFIKGAEMRVQVTKDGNAYQITRAPLKSMKSKPSLN